MLLPLGALIVTAAPKPPSTAAAVEMLRASQKKGHLVLD